MGPSTHKAMVNRAPTVVTDGTLLDWHTDYTSEFFRLPLRPRAIPEGFDWSIRPFRTPVRIPIDR